MKRLKNFLWFLYKCFAFYTLVVYALIQWIPSGGWLAGFMMMSFPAVIVVHILSIPIWFLVDRKRSLLPLLLLLLGSFFLPRTFAFGSSQDAGAANQRSFSVMSYNTHIFMKNDSDKGLKQKSEIESMKKWVQESGADVLCMPEYINDGSLLFNTDEGLEKAGYTYKQKYSRWGNRHRNFYIGLALFSKHPIIQARDTIFEEQNGLIQADIKIHQDTIRVIALHLYSMTLNLNKLAHQRKMEGLKAEGKSTLGRMKTGFIQRARELKVLESWIADSPYPVIVCGDFNEVPYGYVYGKLKESLNNSFEEKGKGFGFTFNHIPYFIRIDHQFYTDKSLQVVSFKTLNEVKYSDHYPIIGTYQLK